MIERELYDALYMMLRAVAQLESVGNNALKDLLPTEQRLIIDNVREYVKNAKTRANTAIALYNASKKEAAND